ncbi:hydrogenase 2 maturation endopeptidase [Azospira sp. I13]|jgi:hydrogenase maturation protease|uniref:HyaD/HybD family hydrogenase maturation endopeptidase n=1 Tax=Azospira sp. I13 TaxID=1765050 RepID=UPI000D47D05E|nr:HyaD/HybD family hydrogenase maturation endopeptidase [Azospira sp. I13]GBG02743.1 hydrogenase 2 maturation endopeptidase [Azospira sp. I13]
MNSALHAPRIAVLGVGNILLTDEGIGVRVIEALQSRYRLPDHVLVLDGGTAGMELLEPLEGLDALIIADAVRVGQPPGSVVLLQGDEVPAFFRTKISPHQIGLSDLLAALELTEQAPKHVSLIGLQPVSLDTGMALTAEAEARVPEMLALVVAELAKAGVMAEPVAGEHA